MNKIFLLEADRDHDHNARQKIVLAPDEVTARKLAAEPWSDFDADEYSESEWLDPTSVTCTEIDLASKPRVLICDRW